MQNDQAHATIEVSRDGIKMEASAGPQTLLAVSLLVSGILLSTAVIVWAATAAPRKPAHIAHGRRG